MGKSFFLVTLLISISTINADGWKMKRFKACSYGSDLVDGFLFRGSGEMFLNISNKTFWYQGIHKVTEKKYTLEHERFTITEILLDTNENIMLKAKSYAGNLVLANLKKEGTKIVIDVKEVTDGKKVFRKYVTPSTESETQIYSIFPNIRFGD